LSYHQRSVQPASATETWKCSQCGSQLIGTRVSRRSALAGKKFPVGTRDYIQSKCARCGNTMCGLCLDLQKPNAHTPDHEVLCPECGAKFGDGPVLMPEQVAARYDTEGIGVEATGYVKDLRSWAGWLIFWSIVNFFGMASLMSEAASSPEVELGVPDALVVLSLFGDVIVFFSAVICLASRVPWAGFYVIFSLYLISIGVLNLFAKGFWTFLGIVQIIIGLAVIGKGSSYSASRTDRAL
jgi:DNA-directed RNA polymerase subunit RPC12/RpoP